MDRSLPQVIRIVALQLQPGGYHSQGLKDAREAAQVNETSLARIQDWLNTLDTIGDRLYILVFEPAPRIEQLLPSVGITCLKKKKLRKDQNYQNSGRSFSLFMGC
jgi:hypothetical protein